MVRELGFMRHPISMVMNREWGRRIPGLITPGLPNRAIIYLSETPPNSIRWLTKNDADNVGIDVVWLGRDEFPSIWMARPTSPQAQPQQLPPPQASPAPPIAAEPTPSLEERARRFVDAIFGARNQAALDWLHVRYKDTTRYYGKVRTRQEVTTDLEQFFKRWPERAYRPIPDSILVACKTTSNCVASGLFEFWARNGDRVRVGWASFAYWLSFSGDANFIDGEDGAVLWRSPQPQTQTKRACIAGANELNFRSGPSTGHEILTTLPEGAAPSFL
jgi:hypothetical protein